MAGQQIYTAKDEHGKTIFCIDGGLIRYIEGQAEGDAEERERKQDRSTVEGYVPDPEQPDEESPDEDEEDQDRGPDEEPPAAAPAIKRRPKGPRP